VQFPVADTTLIGVQVVYRSGHTSMKKIGVGYHRWQQCKPSNSQFEIYSRTSVVVSRRDLVICETGKWAFLEALASMWQRNGSQQVLLWIRSDTRIVAYPRPFCMGAALQSDKQRYVAVARSGHMFVLQFSCRIGTHSVVAWPCPSVCGSQ
jgi:hypothetical protein